jgi:predicted nucleic acid-binding protein
MGSLTALLRGPVYVGANILIYTVERVEPYAMMLDPFWQALAARRQRAHERTRHAGDVSRPTARGRRGPGGALSQHPLSLSELAPDTDFAAHPRARCASTRPDPTLKTPDAIHAATALEAGAN